MKNETRKILTAVLIIVAITMLAFGVLAIVNTIEYFETNEWYAMPMAIAVALSGMFNVAFVPYVAGVRIRVRIEKIEPEKAAT